MVSIIENLATNFAWIINELFGAVSGTVSQLSSDIFA